MKINRPKVEKRKNQKNDFFKRLIKTRQKIADEAGLKPTLVAGDDDLTLLSVVRPSNHTKMLELEGFTKVKVERLKSMINDIVDFCDENELDLDQPILDETKPSQVSFFEEFTPAPLSPVIQNTYDLFKSGHDIKSITKETKHSKVMIITHLSGAIESGWAVNCSRLGVDLGLTNQIVQEIRANDSVVPKIPILMSTLGISMERTKISLALIRLCHGLGKCNFGQKRIIDSSDSDRPAAKIQRT